MMEIFSFSPAIPTDKEVIRALLQEAGLPHQDFTEHLEHFITARHSEQVVGAVGLEVYKKSALLRSLVVRPDFRGQELGRLLTTKILAFARSLDLEELYLLTTTAAEFFPKFGFEICERGAAPPDIQATVEFASLCPSTAVCMYRKI